MEGSELVGWHKTLAVVHETRARQKWHKRGTESLTDNGYLATRSTVVPFGCG
jgi:hypothetical protein